MIPILKRLGAVAAVLMAIPLLYAAPAAAQATRTWVSGVGDDVNPCSRTAPCKTFAGAISKTAAGGEINCLDPGGWGSVTITKSMTIDCSQFPGSILNSVTSGVIVNAAATDVIVLRGLEISGGAGASAGLNGVRFLAGATLIMENMIIRNNTQNNGTGILFTPNGNAQLFINNVTVVNNGNGMTGGGIIVTPTAGGSARVTINNARIAGNAVAGLRLDSSSTANPAGVLATVSNSNIASNAVGVFSISPAGGEIAYATVVDSTVSYSGDAAFSSNGQFAVIIAARNMVMGNTRASQTANLGEVQSFGDNMLVRNVLGSSFNPPVLTKQ